MNSINNKYIDTYIINYIKPFRDFIKSKYIINIDGLADFIDANDRDVSLILHRLQKYNFEVTISNGEDIIDDIRVEYICEENGKHESFEYKIENLISTLNLSSNTEISIIGILIMQIISRLICKYKTMYKAIILDLDDTLWKGTLSEDGIDNIKHNLHSHETHSFATFMRFIRTMSKELGLYVAVCSRNEIEEVQSAINELNEEEFPIKGEIDCIIANYNDKSENIKAIAQRLSILTNACVFIDDNPLIRDEVRQNLPEVFVPDWENHNELITLLIACCIFDRFELSMKSRNRRRQFEILQQIRRSNSLPKLYVKVIDDTDHKEATKLYAKSNQFKLVSVPINYDGAKSIYFEIYRTNGENLGICSVITYSEDSRGILNWAISCRYFGIGLEEFIMLYLLENNIGLYFAYQFDVGNLKVEELMNKYYGKIITDSCDSVQTNSDIFIDHFKDDCSFKDLLLKLKGSKSNYNVYWLGSGSITEDRKLLNKASNLKLRI